MMSVSIQLAALLAFALAYRAYRRVFDALPLHMDTAFYVPNHVVLERKYTPFRGWNAEFSAVSRLLPEAVHSLLYLRTGGQRYGRAFRALYTSLALVASAATGVAAALVLRNEAAGWSAALVTAALLAETQYGTYFESAEAFEVALQAVGVALVLSGLEADACAMVLAGVALLWLDVVLVKLTGAIAAVLVSLAAAWFMPACALPVAGLAVAAALGYLSLLRASGRNVRQALGYLRLHEQHIRRNYPNPLKLLAVKLGFAVLLLLRNPPLPLLAAVGLLQLGALPLAEETHRALCVYGALAIGATAAMLTQGNRVWYYMIPLLPPLALCTAAAQVGLSSALGPSTALIAVVAAVALSVLRNLWQVRGGLGAGKRVWSVYNRPGGAFGDAFAEGNQAVEHACSVFRSELGPGATVLVVGRHNQAYVLLGTAYDTPLVSVCELAQGVAGDLRERFPSTDGARLPRYLLDTENALEHFSAAIPWLADYAVLKSVGTVRLLARSEAASSTR